jgi:hypothetical protein
MRPCPPVPQIRRTTLGSGGGHGQQSSQHCSGVAHATLANAELHTESLEASHKTDPSLSCRHKSDREPVKTATTSARTRVYRFQRLCHEKTMVT